MAEKEAKADLAFKVFDKNHDGYITKEEMLKTSKNLTKKQVISHLFTIWKKVLCISYLTKKPWFWKFLMAFQVQAVFELNDADHDGKLTREEFHEFMTHPQKDNSNK